MTFSEGTRLDSSRVQRRGRGGGSGSKVAVGGGFGGILLLLLFYFLGADPAQVGLNQGFYPEQTVDHTVAQDFAERCQTGADANAYADCRVVATVASLDEFWEDQTWPRGRKFTLPGVVVFDSSTSSACGHATQETGPFYCPSDAGIYVDTEFFSSLRAFGYQDGPLAEAYIMAHEYGHHVQNLLGVFELADRSSTGPESDTVKVELMADCLAGVWLQAASTVPDPHTGIPFLEPISEQQLENALAAAAAVGDDRIQETILGEVEPHKFSHGTSAQRTTALLHGYEQGTPASCDLFSVY